MQVLSAAPSRLVDEGELGVIAEARIDVVFLFISRKKTI
jgi:hypothetical protein